jgi:hypothetical protein
MVSDEAGGAIIAWEDFCSGTNNDIYSQRINASGTVRWTANGVPISAARNYQLMLRRRICHPYRVRFSMFICVSGRCPDL